jgi:hypothetical protein
VDGVMVGDGSLWRLVLLFAFPSLGLFCLPGLWSSLFVSFSHLLLGALFFKSLAGFHHFNLRLSCYPNSIL